MKKIVCVENYKILKDLVLRKEKKINLKIVKV